MFTTYPGELAALATAIFWTITALSFESASLKVGSLPVNIIRLFIGFAFLSLYGFFIRGLLLPTDANVYNWGWLLFSGVVGFLFGDLFLFKSYTLIGSRFAMLIMTTVPPMAALLGWLILNETITIMNFVGMTLTLVGISLAIFSKQNAENKLRIKLPTKGIIFALFGALGQAGGLVISKLGMQNYDPFAATQIRIIAGIFGFIVLVTIMGRWNRVLQALKNTHAMIRISVGAFFGPFLGVGFSLLAIKYTQTGIASTIMSIVPILIIPPAVLFYKQKITLAEVIGSIISIGGVALFFIHF